MSNLHSSQGFGRVEERDFPRASAGRGRPAYTLLEVLLATAIGVVLLAAVYVALEVQLFTAQAGREKVEQSTLARSILARMEADITTNLGTIDPARYRPSRRSGGQSSSSASAPSNTSNSSTTGTSTTGGSTTSGTSATGNGNTSSAAAGSTTSTTGTDPSQTTLQDPAVTGAARFYLGVQGDMTSMTLSVSRLPREMLLAQAEVEPDILPLVSDLRCIKYWLVGEPGTALGLARQEIKVATADEALTPQLPAAADDAAYLLAEEVRSLEISYFDGTAWVESWDGSAVGSDGYTPIGPPRAIAIVIGIGRAGGANPGEPEQLQYFRHVVAIPVADGAQQAQQAQPITP